VRTGGICRITRGSIDIIAMIARRVCHSNLVAARCAAHEEYFAAYLLGITRAQ
jgi:hypothetical protein